MYTVTEIEGMILRGDVYRAVEAMKEIGDTLPKEAQRILSNEIVRLNLEKEVLIKKNYKPTHDQLIARARAVLGL